MPESAAMVGTRKANKAEAFTESINPFDYDVASHKTAKKQAGVTLWQGVSLWIMDAKLPTSLMNSILSDDRTVPETEFYSSE